MNLYHFNPDTDDALAHGDGIYTPTAKVKAMQRARCLIQALAASPGDAILVDNDFDADGYKEQSHLEAVTYKNIRLVTFDELVGLEGKVGRFLPWGWNHTLKYRLEEAGIDKSLLKWDNELYTLRELAHRRTAIRFLKEMDLLLPEIDVPLAVECRFPSIALEMAELPDEIYMKMPWSSSGRGVISTKRLFGEKLRQWVEGAISRQGSITMEWGQDRTGDFATEWWMENGRAFFTGLSEFNISPKGKYLSNCNYSQQKIEADLKRLSPQWSSKIVEAQCTALEKIVSDDYEGPIGIDMLTDAEGKLNPCVEINFRQTMGMMANGKVLP